MYHIRTHKSIESQQPTGPQTKPKDGEGIQERVGNMASGMLEKVEAWQSKALWRKLAVSAGIAGLGVMMIAMSQGSFFHTGFVGLQPDYTSLMSLAPAVAGVGFGVGFFIRHLIGERNKKGLQTAAKVLTVAAPILYTAAVALGWTFAFNQGGSFVGAIGSHWGLVSMIATPGIFLVTAHSIGKWKRLNHGSLNITTAREAADAKEAHQKHIKMKRLRDKELEGLEPQRNTLTFNRRLRNMPPVGPQIWQQVDPIEAENLEL